MRKYHLFIINKEVYFKYKNKSYVLYKILESLYNLTSYDFSFGFNIYKQICMPFAVKILKNYIKEKMSYIKINNKVIKISNKEDIYLNINYASTIIKTSVNLPSILRIFNIYNKYIFVCDFKNKDYFWLDQEIRQHYKIKNI